MNMIKLSAALVVGGLSLAAIQTPAFAASAMTNVFLNNALPNVDFLDRSSRFALTNSKSARVKDYAHAEAANQTRAANAFDDWVSADTRPQVAAVEAPLQTGRSVAIDGQTAPTVDNRLPMGQEDLDSIEGLNGQEFDDQYKAKQLTALSQLETDYADYIAKGDDPVLLGVAGRELPKVRKQMAELRKL